MTGCINFKKVFYFLLLAGVFLPVLSAAQSPGQADNLLFYQLTNAQGLSDNQVNTMVTDKNGNLWIGTPEGLNRFNGKTVTRYLKQDYPQLANDNIQGLLCDEANRIWVRCDDGFITLIDEDRKFKKITIYDNGSLLPVRRILHTAEYGITGFTRKGFFSFSKNKNQLHTDTLIKSAFTPIPIPGMDTLAPLVAYQLEQYDSSSFILCNKNFFSLISFKEKKITGQYNFPDVLILLQWKPGELLVYDRREKEVKSINLLTKQTGYPFKNIKDQFGRPLAQRIGYAKKIDTETLLLTSLRDGLYLFNTRSKKLTQYTHRSGDPSTLLNNRPSVIHRGYDGWVFIGSRLNGISYFKTGAVIRQQNYFADKSGNSYDGYINSIISKEDNIYYIGTGNNLLRWNRLTNSCEFINYANFDGKPVVNEEGAAQLSFDRLGRLWFITSTKGIVVLGKNEEIIKQFPFDSIKPGSIKATWVEKIVNGNDGWVWLATDNGVRRINPVSFEIDDLGQTVFHQLNGATCMEVFFNDPGSIWIATLEKGLWQYSVATKTIRQFTNKDGLISNWVACLNKDNDGNIYIGTDKGLQIFYKNGRTKKITQQDGLANSRVNVLVPDNKNRMWIGNVTGIACYNPADSSLVYFDQAYGLSSQGLRRWGYFNTTVNEFYWTTENGIQYFYPDELYNYKPAFKSLISRIESGKLAADLTLNKEFRLAVGDNNVTFHFSTIEYLAQIRTFYKYKLESQDKNWVQVVNQNSVRYNSLVPGKYVFKLMASNDNKNWIMAENEITIYVTPPFYKTWWFRLLAVIVILCSGYIFLHRREKFVRKKEAGKTELEKLRSAAYRYQLEIEQVTGYFATAISAHHSKDDLLWDVAKNLIGKLGFEDCMIYLWNENKTMLLQKAGYGVKGSMQVEQDKNIYHIPKGKGIVGAAVDSKQYLLVNDTSLDNRYFAVDDNIRLSELCIPVLHNNETIGAINTEHSGKNFYTDQHVQILTTIAAMLADKIDMIDAQQQAREKEMEVLKLNKDLATSQLTTLRAQMNPHFIFNALNSVQQYILQGNITEANRYLSKFSKLQREVLNHSDQDFISLEKELEVLNLYLELEQLRFESNFSYEIKIDTAIDDDEIKIPPMIVQPFVENAIWHGLMPKLGERWVQISFKMKTDDLLECIVKDNGIGRIAAARLKNNNHEQHKSKGLSLVYDRLHILRQQYGQAFDVSIHDITDENNLPAGTEVRLHIYTG